MFPFSIQKNTTLTIERRAEDEWHLVYISDVTVDWRWAMPFVWVTPEQFAKQFANIHIELSLNSWHGHFTWHWSRIRNVLARKVNEITHTHTHTHTYTYIPTDANKNYDLQVRWWKSVHLGCDMKSNYIFGAFCSDLMLC